MWWRRSPLYEIRDLADLLEIINETSPDLVLVDLEPLIALWGSAPTPKSCQQLDALAARARTIIVTNSGRDLGFPHVTTVPNAGKPWTSRRALADPGGFLIVAGDQLLTDGLLAYRLRGAFALQTGIDRPPWWPRVQAMMGKLLRPLLFESQRVTGGNRG